MEQTQGLGDKIDRLLEVVETQGNKQKKPKNFRMPLKGKVGKGKLGQGYVTIIEIAENSALNFRKEQIIDSTVKLGDTFHAVDQESLLTFKGKPVFIIPKKSKNPFNPNKIKNETFGQKHIMSRMMNEIINSKKKIGALGISAGVIILGGVALYAFIAG